MENTETNYEYERAIAQQKEEVRVQKLVEDMTDYLNSYSYKEKSEAFNQKMSNQHRTLQQNFTRLVLGWVEHVASPEYRTDPRNEGSKEACKALIEGFTKLQADNGFTGETLALMSKPSGHLGTV